MLRYTCKACRSSVTPAPSWLYQGRYVIDRCRCGRLEVETSARHGSIASYDGEMPCYPDR